MPAGGAHRPSGKREVPWSEWAHPKNQGKHVTRGELISALNIALNNYRRKHTLRGRIGLYFAADWARTKREMRELRALTAKLFTRREAPDGAP